MRPSGLSDAYVGSRLSHSVAASSPRPKSGRMLLATVRVSKGARGRSRVTRGSANDPTHLDRLFPSERRPAEGLRTGRLAERVPEPCGDRGVEDGERGGGHASDK